MVSMHAQKRKEALHEPFIRKRQRAAALQDASDGHVLPGFREVLDCASPLALWLPLQKWVLGTDARPISEVEALHESIETVSVQSCGPQLPVLLKSINTTTLRCDAL